MLSLPSPSRIRCLFSQCLWAWSSPSKILAIISCLAQEIAIAIVRRTSFFDWSAFWTIINGKIFFWSSIHWKFLRRILWTRFTNLSIRRSSSIRSSSHSWRLSIRVINWSFLSWNNFFVRFVNKFFTIWSPIHASITTSIKASMTAFFTATVTSQSFVCYVMRSDLSWFIWVLFHHFFKFSFQMGYS